MTIAMAAAITVDTLSGFAVSYASPYMLDSMGNNVGFVFLGFAVAALFWVAFCMPETKGVSRILSIYDGFRLTWVSVLSMSLMSCLKRDHGPGSSPSTRLQVPLVDSHISIKRSFSKKARNRSLRSSL
jgi:hypothetical protein